MLLILVLLYILLLELNNTVLVCWGRSTNIKDITFPMSFTTICQITFGILYNRGQYSYDQVSVLSLTGFEIYSYAANLTQMYICISY